MRTLAVRILVALMIFLIPVIGNSTEVVKPGASTETLYTVQPGDTLNTIADRLGGITWRKLWEANSDTVKDPDLIYPGQKLRISQKIGIKEIPKPISQVEFNERLYKLMFKQLCMSPAPEHTYNAILKYKMRSVGASLDNKNFYKAKQDIGDLRELLIGLETHELSKSITAIYAQDHEMGHLVAALAWKETGFHNRRGKRGELGYYQFLPSTIDKIYGKEKGKLAKVLVEENPWFATQLAVWYLKDLKKTYETWDKVLFHYNGDPDYSGSVLYRTSKVKEAMK